MQVTVQTFPDAEVDIGYKAWLKSKVDLFLYRINSTVCRAAELSQFVQLEHCLEELWDVWNKIEIFKFLTQRTF